jgi:molecular chaperone GrpE
MNETRRHGFDDGFADGDDVEIIEVVGVDEDAPAPSFEEEDPAPRPEEVLLRFDEDGDMRTQTDTANEVMPGSTGAPSWGGPPTQREVEARVDAELIQRLRADYENLRKRVDRERADFEQRANIGLIKRLLPILDGFERALSQEMRTAVDAAMRDGLRMIYEQLCDALRQEGLRPIPVAGVTFDPNMHEAVATDSRTSAPRDTILEEMRRGYLFRDQVLRHSLVKVSTSGQEPEDHGEGA